jgi:hypothetical protein
MICPTFFFWREATQVVSPASSILMVLLQATTALRYSPSMTLNVVFQMASGLCDPSLAVSFHMSSTSPFSNSENHSNSKVCHPYKQLLLGGELGHGKWKIECAVIGPTRFLVVSSFNNTWIGPSIGVSASDIKIPRTKHINASIHIARPAPSCINPYLASRSIRAGVRRLGNGDDTKEEGGG